jgi:hypothetical protein
MARLIDRIPNVTYLRNTRHWVKDGVAVAGANGWWNYRISGHHPAEEKPARERRARGRSDLFNDQIILQAELDKVTLAPRVGALQKDDNVKAILMVTHTVPHKDLLSVSPAKAEAETRQLTMGAGDMAGYIRARDTKSKIKGRVFGHMHEVTDRTLDGVRFLSNPRGSPGYPGAQQTYAPRALSVSAERGLTDSGPPAPPRLKPGKRRRPAPNEKSTPKG